MKLYVTSAPTAPIPIPRAVKWYEQPATFDYFGGDQFAFTPSPPPPPPRPPSLRRAPSPAAPECETLWQYLKYLWRGDARAP